MTQITLKIEELSDSEKHQPQGNWGVQLAPGECLAWQCPMLGDGGSTSENRDAIGWLLASYDYGLAGGSEEEGPDEFIFTDGDRTFYVEVEYNPK